MKTMKFKKTSTVATENGKKISYILCPGGKKEFFNYLLYNNLHFNLRGFFGLQLSNFSSA